MREQQRITFVLERDGVEAALVWALRTLRIYRRAALDPRQVLQGELQWQR